MTRPESWKPVPRYEGLYEVSDMGRVRSLDRQVPHYRGGVMLRRGKTLSLPERDTGHPGVGLHRDGKQETCAVHVLVLDAFVGPCPAGMESLHGPGGPADNRWPENLSYGTKRANMLDKHRDGTFAGVKLTPELVLACRARRTRGETWTAIAADYGVGQSTVRAAVTGKTWAWVRGRMDAE